MQYESQKTEIIQQVVTDIRAKLPGETCELAAAFAQRYYQQAFVDDLVSRPLDDLYGAVVSHFYFAQHRLPGQVLLRIYNPELAEQGWHTTHSVIELVCDDMPFIVDSLIMAFNRSNISVHAILHPILTVQRTANGQLQNVVDDGYSDAHRESIIHLQIDRQIESQFAPLIADLHRVLQQIKIVVADWQAMRNQLLAIAAELRSNPEADAIEINGFLEWLAADHFTFLGFREYRLMRTPESLELFTLANSGLGLLRDAETADYRSQSFGELPDHLKQLAVGDELLTLSKSGARSPIHRPVHLDYVGVKKRDPQGQVIGEYRFLGLYTATAYRESPRGIPWIRQKAALVFEKMQLPPHGHAYRALTHLIDHFPRDELFQMPATAFLEMVSGILALRERQLLKAFIYVDQFERFVSCLIYIPRDRYNTQLREQFAQLLLTTFGGFEATFNTQFSDSVLARLHLHLRVIPGKIPPWSIHEIETALRAQMLSWEDQFYQALLTTVGEVNGNELFRRYRRALTPAYRQDFSPKQAVGDALRLAELTDDRPIIPHFYQVLEDPKNLVRLKIYRRFSALPLAQILPLLESLGLKALDANSYAIELENREIQWVVSFTLQAQAIIPFDARRRDLHTALMALLDGTTECDGLNGLVLNAGLAWRPISVFRAMGHYLRQTPLKYSQAYLQQTLNQHGTITAQLFALFEVRLRPERADELAEQQQQAAIECAISQVTSLDEDRILRAFLALILAITRTNYFQTSAELAPKPYIAFKIDSSQLPDLPQPVPLCEIFVDSPRVEAIHLRGGLVARGGLRWSDRREDFRTEVLGLMKAQMVKNAVIVPSGAKGGFIVKQPPVDDPNALRQEAVDCYRTFIQGLLDLTDNRVGETCVPPPQVRRRDGDDSYLVVAADKGTATFSDIANTIAASYGFWLGDAFASGGSQGYDHKRMGITARGAWESVRRHFRELGREINQRDEITVVGIGDMSGDVFGNGLLCSPKVRLLAAFDHRHIFLDPQPDPAASYAERQRLFALPSSSWADYDPQRLSPGGGVYSRQRKTIAVSPEAQAVLGLDRRDFTPDELISAVLKAPVDLLWNGGIGTYVKARHESHSQVGDRHNDNVRVNGDELRCTVVGEGGNLGFTQAARVEFAAAGGRIFTDAIDNAAGVNCSDHEVNLKILLNRLVEQGDMTVKQRNQRLVEMTDAVAARVLRQNYLQPQALMRALAQLPAALDDYRHALAVLVAEGGLNRRLEGLPTDAEWAKRPQLYAPELAVLLAYTKNFLNRHLLQSLLYSDLRDDPFWADELHQYFPEALHEFAAAMGSHPLKAEIIATYTANSLVNRMGIPFIFRMQRQTGADYAAIAQCYTAARELFAMRGVWRDIEVLDDQVATATLTALHLATVELLERVTLYLLRRPSMATIHEHLQQYQAPLAAIVAACGTLLDGEMKRRCDEQTADWVAAGVPSALAAKVATLAFLDHGLALVDVAQAYHVAPTTSAALFFALNARLR